MPILHHERVVGPDAQPESWLAVLHGIYGAGRNWRTVAGRIVQARPDWGVVLVDLRQHGRSQGFARPHTLEAAAGDLRELFAHADLPVRGVLGHSFGGKVALTYARAPAGGLDQVWMIDSAPGRREAGGSAWRVLGVLRGHPGPFGSRKDAVDLIVADGWDQNLAQWLTTNLVLEADEYRWRIDADAMEELMRDYFRTDGWDVLESPSFAVAVHIVRATQSSVVDAETRRRVEALSATGRVALHDVEGGHWLNADNPDELVRLLATHL